MNKKYSETERLRAYDGDCSVLPNASPNSWLPRRLISLNRKEIRNAIKKRLPDWYFVIQEWRKVHGRFPNFLWPATFNEKVLHRILFDRRPVLTQFADKFAVRSYVEQRIGSKILPKSYYLTKRPETIPFDELPDKFVVKPTHGCGWVQIVTDKSTLDRTALVQKCLGWLNQSYYEKTREWAYKNVEPRILVEEFVDEGSGTAPYDYKLFVFDGTVELVQVDAGRFGDHRRRLYTPAWQEMDARFGESEKIVDDVARPRNLAAMIAAAETLGRGLDFVRADFYDTGDRIYLGELTMTPGCGHNRFRPRELDLYFGERWKLRTG